MAYSQKALAKIFGTNEETEEEKKKRLAELEEKLPVRKTQVLELAIDNLSDFPNHPFKPYTEEKLKALEQSIRENGIINPLIVRRLDEKYQIVCGHNRKKAAKQACFITVPCMVRDLSDDEANILMVESNLLSRNGLLPSEKAFAYKIKLDAMKRQGYRGDLTSRHDVGKFETVDLIGSDDGESGRQVQRYVRLTELITPLLDMVDDKKLPFMSGVALSYLSTVSQTTVHKYFFVDHNLNIDVALAEKLKELGKSDEITDEDICRLLNPEQFKAKHRNKLVLKMKKFKKYFNESESEQDIENTILEALEYYYKNKDNSRGLDDD